MKLTLALVASCLVASQTAVAQETFAGSAALDAAVDQAVHDGLIPGAVLVVGHDGKILHRKAYGQRALVPAREPMTIDTIFDAASLTKVIATTSCVMKLFEEGKLRIADPVTAYLPEFQGGKSDITIRDLMTHFSGLRPDLDLDARVVSGYETGIHRALIDKPAGPPGVRFVYSDINFELLGEIVHRLSGKTAGPVCSREDFRAAGDARDDISILRLAGVRASRRRRSILRRARRFAAWCTIRRRGTWAAWRGTRGCSRPRPILSKFAEMMLGDGRNADGVRIFSPLTVRKFTSPETPPDQPVLRGLGWDIDSSLFVESRRAVSDRLVRTHWIHRNVGVDRSVDEIVRDPADEFGASERGQESHGVSQPRRDDFRGGDRSGCAGRGGCRIQRDDGRRGRAASDCAESQRAHRTRCAGAGELRAAQRQARRTDHESDRPRSCRANAISTR